MKVFCKHISFLLLLLLATTLSAQIDTVVQEEEMVELEDSSFVEEVEEETMEQHHFDDKKWEKLRKELNYTIEKKKEEIKPPSGVDWNFNPSIIKTILWLFLGAVVIFLIVLFIINWRSSPKNHKIKKEAALVADYIPENIEGLNLQGLLTEAVTAGSYREAIRMYYLMILRDLSNKKLIVLKKNSISREFLQALHGHKYYYKFFVLTRLFEKVWYGDYDIEAHDFPAASAMFEEFIKTLNPEKK